MKKCVKGLLGLLVFLAVYAGPVEPAQATCGDGASNCFVRTGGGNWSTGTTWATSSGGGSCACTPAAGDSVVMDANSGNSTIDAAFSIANLTATGFTGTLTHNASTTLTVTGTSFTFVSGMTYAAATNTRLVQFTGTGTLALTSGGKTFGAFTVNGTGGTVVLQDAFAVRSDGTLTLTAGTFDGNNRAVSVGLFSSAGAGVTRVLTRGSGAWSITGTAGSVWDLSNAAGNLTLTSETSTLTFTAAATSVRTVALGTSKTYSAITLANTGNNTNTIDLSAGVGVTVGTLLLSAPIVARLSSSITYTVSNALAWVGTAYNNTITITAISGVAPTMALGAASSCSWCAIGGITFSTNTLAATNSFDLKGNSGTVSIAGPSGGITVGGFGFR